MNLENRTLTYEDIPWFTEMTMKRLAHKFAKLEYYNHKKYGDKLSGREEIMAVAWETFVYRLHENPGFEELTIFVTLDGIMRTYYEHCVGEPFTAEMATEHWEFFLLEFKRERARLMFGILD